MKQLMLILSLSAALAACSRQAEGPAGPRPEATPADLAAGRALAEQECQGCHGLDGRGTAPGIPNLAAQSERYLHVSVDEYVKGKRTHAALRDMIVGMTEENRRNVIAYYASLAPLPHWPLPPRCRLLPGPRPSSRWPPSTPCPWSSSG